MIVTRRLLLIFLIHLGVVACVHERLKRFLLFPRANPTRLQFIAGIGLPVDLELESITVGYVLKAEYFLPYNASHFKPAYIEGFGERRRVIRELQPEFKSVFDQTERVATEMGVIEQSMPAENQLSENSLETMRWNLYKAFELLLNSQGYSGRSCLLRTICEAATHPFVFGEDNTLLDELMHVFFTPSTSNDKLSHYMDNEYRRAEQLGRSSALCKRIFRECPHSPMEMFSMLLHDDASPY